MVHMTDELPWDYGQMLTSYIERSGLSRREVARRAGISAPTVTNLESGTRPAGDGVRVPNRNPDAQTVYKIAMVLDMPLRTALEAAGISVPPDMDDDAIKTMYRTELDDLVDRVPIDVLLAAIERRVKGAKHEEES